MNCHMTQLASYIEAIEVESEEEVLQVRLVATLHQFAHNCTRGEERSTHCWLAKKRYLASLVPSPSHPSFCLAFSPRLQDKSWGGKDWERGYYLASFPVSTPQLFFTTADLHLSGPDGTKPRLDM